MISAVSFFFGTTLIYTGYLASGRDLTTGIVVACTGFVLMVKPTLEATRYCMTHFGGSPPPHRSNKPQKAKTRKVYLKVVKSEDDKPTIH